MKRLFSLPQKALFCLSASFLIPLGILVGCMYLLDLAPFGEDSLLLIDSASQYVNYLGYFRSVLTGDSSLFYTFSKNLGGDLLSLAAYYMLSPFNLLLLFSDILTLPLAFTGIVVLKLSCCGLSYYYASSRFFGHNATHLAFSTAYALMGYTIVYEWNIMWLDGVMILPLLFWGLYRLVTQEKIGLYAFCIAYALVTSFYTGYMLCAASVLFFLALIIVSEQNGKAVVKTGVRFAWGSAIGGFAAAPAWLPAVMTLGSNRITLSGESTAFSWKTNLLDFPAKFTAGAANTLEIYDGMPQVFCGTLVIVLVLLFFLNSGIPRRIRLTVLGVIGVFLASFCLSPLDVAWHGFSPNRLFNFRYSFIFTFVLILTGQYSLTRLGRLSAKKLLLPAGVLLTLLLAAALRRPDLALPGVFVTLLVAVLCLPALWFLSRNRRCASLLLALVTIFELGINCGLTWDKMCQGTLKLNYLDYYYYVDYVQPAIREAQQLEEGFYRIEKTFQKDQNDALLFGYSGLSHFSSTEPAGLMQFLKRMGLRNYFDVWSAYLSGSTADADALLGIRYLLSNEDQAALKGYELVSAPNGIGIYRNPNALPLAVLSDPAISQIRLTQENYFESHNAIWTGLTGQPQQILQREDRVSLSLHNLTDTLQDDGTHLYTKTDPDADAALRFTITVSQNLPLYCYFTAPAEEQPVSLLINGEDCGAYFDAFRWNMVHAGTYEPGDTLVIELVPMNNSFVFDQGWFCYEDRDALARAADQVRQTPVNLNRISDSRLTGSFVAESESVLFFTIPWDTGWHLTLDGKEVPFDRALDTFLSVPVSAGTHSFSMEYVPAFFHAGVGLTGLSALMALVWYIWARKQKKQNIQEDHP